MSGAEPVDAPLAGAGDAPDLPPGVAEHLRGDREPDHDSVARTICLRLLTARARTRQELHDALSAHDVPGPVIARVLDRYAEVGLVDDAAFAEQFVTARRQGRGLSGREIARQLAAKGVSEEIVSGALADLSTDEERATAESLVRRRLATLARFDEPTKVRRLVGMLARKGYSPGMAYSVVSDALKGEK